MIDPKVFRQVRKALGLTQDELGKALGLSRITVNKMERGRLVKGIPDEIANRLMALKPRAGAIPSPDYIALHAKDPNVKDDSHLWDNEEEDES